MSKLDQMQGEELARLFHETYEHLAPEFGYRTRERSAVPWHDVPPDNKKLMVATANAVLHRLRTLAATDSTD